MPPNSQRIPKKLVDDFRHNRQARLSSRQMLELLTEPVVPTLLVFVPILLIFGRSGMAGKWIALGLLAALVVMIARRALQIARGKISYGVVYVEGLPPAWMVWRRAAFASEKGEPIKFHRRIAGKLRLEREQALQVYAMQAGRRRVLLSMIPQAHPKADLAEPGDDFQRRGGTILD